MNNNIIIRVVLFGALAIISIIAAQSYWVMNTWDLKEKEFHEKVNIALLNVAGEFKKLGRNLPDFDLINQVSSNYYIVNVNDDINVKNLEFFLQRELERVALTEDFEYGIYDCGTNKMVYGEYITYQPLGAGTEGLEKSDLPALGEFEYYFGVRFPNRTSQILSNMRPTIALTTILLATTIFFLYSIWVILRQKRLSEMQKDFINNMTHEFKTPISTIRISADTFLGNEKVKNDPRLKQYAQIIKQQNQRLNNQVEKVLQIARIEQDSFKLNKEEINLHELLDSIFQSTRLKIETNGGTLDSELNASYPIIRADRLHLTNILHNLLDNAVKYCQEVPEVKVRTKQKGSRILFEIEDKGIGIAKEYQSRIFDKFYRVPTGNVHNVKGFGLGLFYIKNICRAHGWKLDLQSEIGEGTKISILI